MQFLILNQLLTSSVSDLFQRQQIKNPMNFNSLGIEGQFQSRNSDTETNNLKKVIPHNQVCYGRSQSQPNYHFVQLSQTRQSKIWSTSESLKRLKQSLEINDFGFKEQNQLDKHLQGLSLSKIITQKRMVKQELKFFDEQFASLYQRLPSHNQKQHLRPLYIYYKKLRGYIHKRGGKQFIFQKIQIIKEERKKLREKINDCRRTLQRRNDPTMRQLINVEPVQGDYEQHLREFMTQIQTQLQLLQNDV